ncbi:MAG: hypothetical protein JST28_07065 [Acidobacteria bacterium]|nr:hypothetical protein [Acidobacteriota bacterium]
MTKGLLLAGVTVLLLWPAAGIAQDKGYWRAESNTANQITGDVVISESKLTINFLSYSLAPIRKLTQAEAGAAFDVDSNVAGGGNLYRLSIPADKRFLHHNTLCGSEETQWMATYVQDRTLHVALFSGATMPVLTAEALSSSNEVCGVFGYAH